MLHRILFILLLLSSFPLYANNTTILVVGDSLSAAYGINQHQSWVNLLQQKLLTLNYHYKVVNASVSGDTSQTGLSRLATSLTLHQPSILILELGANDALQGLDLKQTYSNLSQIIETAQNQKAQVLLIGVRLPTNYGKQYNALFHKMYQQLSTHYSLAYLPYMLDKVADDPGLFQADGLHPSQAAQTIILQNIWLILVHLLSQ